VLPITYNVYFNGLQLLQSYVCEIITYSNSILIGLEGNVTNTS